MKIEKCNFIITLNLLSILLLIEHDLWSQISQHKFPKPAQRIQFSDELLIKSTIYKFRESVKNQDEKLFERYISKDFEDSTGSVIGKSAAKNKFIELVKNQNMSLRSTYSQRRTPKLRNIKPTWDFDVYITDIKLVGNSKAAHVNCDIYFSMDQPDDIPGVSYAKGPKKAKDKIKLIKENGEWKIIKVNHFFKFLKDRKDRLEGWNH